MRWTGVRLMEVLGVTAPQMLALPRVAMAQGGLCRLLAYGALDKVAPYAASYDMDRVLEQNGGPHDVLVFPNSGHALNRDANMADQLGGLINDYLSKYAALD